MEGSPGSGGGRKLGADTGATWGQTRGNAAGGSRPAPASAQRGPRAGSPGAAMVLRAEQDERGQQPGQRVHGLGPVGAAPTRRRGPAGRGRSRSCFSGGRGGGGTSGREPEDARRGREGGGARRREPPHLPPRPPHSEARRICRPRAGSTAPPQLEPRRPAEPHPPQAGGLELSIPPPLLLPAADGSFCASAREATQVRDPRGRSSPLPRQAPADRCARVHNLVLEFARGCLWGSQAPGSRFRQRGRDPGGCQRPCSLCFVLGETPTSSSFQNPHTNQSTALH